MLFYILIAYEYPHAKRTGQSTNSRFSGEKINVSIFNATWVHQLVRLLDRLHNPA